MKLNNDIYTKKWNQFVFTGNQDLLSEIYFYYFDKLMRLGLKYAEYDLVEDSIQTVFINLIKYRETIGEVNNLNCYLISSFRHQIFHSLRNQKHFIPIDKNEEELFGFNDTLKQNNVNEEGFEEMGYIINKSLESLTDKQREIIFLRFNTELRYEEIADILNITIDSCYKSIYRSLKIIRKYVDTQILKKESNKKNEGK